MTPSSESNFDYLADAKRSLATDQRQRPARLSSYFFALGQTMP
jgi:hypothetical protein